MSGNEPQDASLSLLYEAFRDATDSDYRPRKSTKSAKPKPARTWLKVACAVLLVLAGILFAASRIDTRNSSQEALQERNGLIQQIEEQDAENQNVRDQVTELNTQIETLRSQALAPNPAQQVQLNRLAASSGAVAVSGPGLVIDLTEDDAASGERLIVDRDLREISNGLWEAGAQAISVNGYRLTSRTAIRQVGLAVTVNYRSLTAPYQIMAIGPEGMQSRFVAGTGGSWLAFLKNNVGVGYQISAEESLTLAEDPGLRLVYAGEPQ